MKSTEQFKAIIQSKLNEIAEKDELFAKSLQKKNKNIDDCIKYVLNTVKASGCNGFSDDEVFSMATHYYDEDDIKVGGPVKCSVVTNHSVELSEEEKDQAKAEAKKYAYEEEVARQKDRLKRKGAKQGKESDTITQTSLF